MTKIITIVCDKDVPTLRLLNTADFQVGETKMTDGPEGEYWTMVEKPKQEECKP